jgi:predicted RNase H-like HicB family nuclease
MKRYPVSINWSDEDSGYIATVPGARGLSAFGESPDEALSQLKVAADAYFKSLKKAGKPMPAFDKVTSFSGQLRLRLPKSLHAELSQTAEIEGISLNTHIISLLSKRQVEKEFSSTIHSLRNIFQSKDSDIVSSARNLPQYLQPQEKWEGATKEYHSCERIH